MPNKVKSSGSDKVLLTVLLKRCCRLTDQRIDHLLKQHAIARSQYRVLYYVATRGEPTQKELLDMMAVQGSTLTPIIDALAQKGWLIRVTADNDKRVKKLRLTPKGKKDFALIPDPAASLDRIVLNCLSKKEASGLEQTLKKIIEELSKEGK